LNAGALQKNGIKMDSIRNEPFFCSWSGGKDSCLALYRAVKAGGMPKILFTMMTEEGKRSRAHGIKLSLLECQAEALGISLAVKNASWDRYEDVFLSTIKGFKAKGIGHGVFGDIDLEGHIQWVERVCSSAGIKAHEPLWKYDRQDLLEEFFSSGFEAIIISVKESLLGKDLLGRKLDKSLTSEFEKAGIDASGEEGEYHTLVVDGPLFSSRIELIEHGPISTNGYCFLDVSAGDLKKNE
jgi:uncharacterized protein (TIGR00290 family)